MGLNVDLTQMLGAPSVVSCPRCKNVNRVVR
jgi:phage FluMu protein Com